MNGYEQRKLQPMPPPKGLTEIELKVYNQLPDLWGDCASTRSRKRYQRFNMHQEYLIQQSKANDTKGAATSL